MKRVYFSRAAALLFAGIGVMHVMMTSIYLSPANLLKMKVEKIVHAYMAPLFYQDWHLFSPNPGFSTTQLWLRCKSLGEPWLDWVDPFAEVQAAHYRNRFTGRGKLLYVYRGIGGRLQESFDELKRECEDRQGTNCSDAAILKKGKEKPEFAVAVRFASDFCSAATGSAPQFTIYEFKTVHLTPKRYSERNTEAKWGMVIERSYGKATASTKGGRI